ncbi:MAG: Fe-S cluster assembly ATPase SufC [Patescibacteria group bacterium]
MAPPSPLLTVSDLHVSVGGKEVVRGVSFQIKEGEIHAVMGPNGSGKSTLVNALMGHPLLEVTGGSAVFGGKDLLAMAAEERAAAGLFLAFQYPKEIAGVTLRNFLFAAYNAQLAARDPKARPTFAPQSGATGGRRLSPIKFKKMLEEGMEGLKMDPAFAERSLNKGFSGGEKKKAEVLQMHILRPRLALLDETDSGLDIDALKTVADGINRMRSPHFSALIVTHYARLLDEVTPDHVHVMVKGKIVESGGAALAQDLEQEGYARFGVREEEISRIALD